MNRTDYMGWLSDMDDLRYGEEERKEEEERLEKKLKDAVVEGDWQASLLNMAQIYRQEDEPEEAMSIYRELEQDYLMQGLVLDHRLGELYHHMMMASQEAGNRKEALYCGKRAIEILDRLPGHALDCADACCHLAGVWMSFPSLDEDRLMEALELYEKALSITREAEARKPVNEEIGENIRRIRDFLGLEAKAPYTSGYERPSVRIPEEACDCHLHIYDPDLFPYADADKPGFPPARVEDYRLLQKRLGTGRCVVVTPSAYGLDNACTLDALERLGDQARAVIVTDNRISGEELIRLDRLGVRGIRFNLVQSDACDRGMIAGLAERINPLGWHICFWMNAETIMEMESFLRDLPCPMIFDHRGHLPASEGISHRAFSIITDLMKEGKAYVKLSALYHDTDMADYSDTIKVGRAYVKAAPGQVLWGTDWPHPSEYLAGREMPDDAYMLDALMDQAGDYETMCRILVDNPARLYRF